MEAANRKKMKVRADLQDPMEIIIENAENVHKI